ncbi:MAG: cysteine desulfurase family protein, partial [Pseudomonadota bacterium]
KIPRRILTSFLSGRARYFDGDRQNPEAGRMSDELIYLDYAATTPLDPTVATRMQEVQRTVFANPASNHVLGRRAADVVAAAEASVRALLGANEGMLLWTSGATESNNLAILGTAEQRAHRGKHLVTMRSEHKAVVDVFRALEKRGFEVTWLPGDDAGVLDIADLEASLRDDTQLVSIMHVNNETGAIQPVDQVGALCRDRDIAFHCDGAQAAGKIPVDVASIGVDLYSVTAHKFYGPKGVGALYVAAGTPLEPQLYGGGQQRRLRPGTMPVDLIAGLGFAAEKARKDLEQNLAQVQSLRDRLLAGLRDVDGVYVNGPEAGGYPGVLNVGVTGVEGESLLLALEPLCVATGSACNSQSKEPSYVLRSLGRSDDEAQSAIRFSIGHDTTAAEIDAAIDLYVRAVEQLRSLVP